jgi:adenylyltransferase/sulfurtransferase
VNNSTTLAQSRVLIVGAGGLGSPASLALAMAGVRRITIMDPDRVDPTNLHRQLWQRTHDVGRSKVQCAAEGLRRAFPHIEVTALQERVTAQNAEALFREHSLVLDGVDDWRAKLMLSDTAVRTDVPLIYGGVLRLSGQAMRVTRAGVCLRCLFEEPQELPTCAQAGVLGSIAGAVGAMQALLAIEVLQGSDDTKESNQGQLRILDGESLRQRIVEVRRAKDCRHG